MWRTRAGEAFQPNPRLCSRVGRASRQRLDGLLLASRSSSIVRAGGVGETAPHARERSGHFERRRSDLPLEPGHAPTRSLAWRSATRTSRTPQPGRASVLPSSRPAALLGFVPSQVCSREPGGCTEQARRLHDDRDLTAATHRFARHYCRSGPTCRSCRSSAPIDFRRGDRPPVGVI